MRFYQDVLGFPLTELIDNRDYPGSSHFFFDIGNGNLLAFFDFPGLDVGPYAEVLGGLHHLAISVEPNRWHQLVLRRDVRHPGALSYGFPGYRWAIAAPNMRMWREGPEQQRFPG